MAGAFARRDLLVHREQRSFSPFIGRRSRAYFAGMSRFTSPKVVDPLRSGSKFHGKRLVTGAPRGRPSRGYLGSGSAQMTLSFKKAVKWWEKGLQSNMNEIGSAEDLADSLKNAGDKLVIVHFFSPGCAGCRALHPKICQFAELNPEVLFLHINYEEHKSMCYSLHVHVLPFFRFYRGAHGRLCSFSCTNATIKKFKDALAKHLTDRCSLGPTKGLEESELLSLAENKDISFTYTRKPAPVPDEAAESTPVITNLPLAPPTCRTTQESVDKAALAAVSR